MLLLFSHRLACQRGFQLRLFGFIGALSYELYLVHVFFLERTGILRIIDNQLAAVFIFVAVVILLSIAFRYCLAKISSGKMTKSKTAAAG